MASQYSSKSPARHECTAPLSLSTHNSHTHTHTHTQRGKRGETTEISSAHLEVNGMITENARAEQRQNTRAQERGGRGEGASESELTT
jgi:hypothetical protein